MSRLAVLTLALATAAGSAQAQQTATERAEAERRQRIEELATIRTNIERSAAERARVEREIESVRADRAATIQAGIEAAARVQGLETRLTDVEARLAEQDRRDLTLRLSLDERRGLIAEVLAVLQRMGRRPPPALLAAPEDVLKSVRTAMLLGTLVPEMREAAIRLVADLEQLAALRRTIQAERDEMRTTVERLTAERLRLQALAETRQTQIAENQRTVEAERLRAAGLAAQAGSLEQLIARMETEIVAAQRAAEAARVSVVPRAPSPADRRQQMAALQNAGRLNPAVAFDQLRGRLALPVSGVRVREFGAPDGLGGTERGQSIATRAGATVTAPADGWVVYSGPFRTYGHLLILNAGGGYHVVLAGMERITVELGQFVLAGEGVGTMGDTAPPAAAVATGSTQPVLYVEFRKDGSTIDPAPWWAPRGPVTTTNERVRG